MAHSTHLHKPGIASATRSPDRNELPRILLLGKPNVGKSALFSALTGMHANVSNYPGTTVALAYGRLELGSGRVFELLDTPGAYSLLPITEEERVARNALFDRSLALVLHVVEARTLDLTLATTVDLKEAGLPVVLVLNMWDEAKKLSVDIDTDLLARRLGFPVLKIVATTGEGIPELRTALERFLGGELPIGDEPQEAGAFWLRQFGPAVDRLASQINGTTSLPAAMPPRVAAALAIRGSKDISEWAGFPPESLAEARQEVAGELGGMPPVAAILLLRARASEILEDAFHRERRPSETLRYRLGLLLAHPLWGLPVLAMALYFGFYQVVGVLAADKMVGFLEQTVFGTWLMPPLVSAVESVSPWTWLSDLLVGDYGILTLGITYALALVLPVVGAFFLVFSVAEDSGYFARLALLCDRLFKRVGLNGRAVITMVLGLGCSTMATVTTRTLENPRDRVLANLLLVLTVPCSAQLGLIMALLGSRSLALWIVYVGCLGLVFLMVGYVAAKVMPGRNATFHMELVPLRLPRLGNVLRKSWLRLFWYFKEVVPLFILASVILWLLDRPSQTLYGTLMAEGGEQPANALYWIKQGMEPFMTLIDQPQEAAESFLIGFFRRDFGAAGLYELSARSELMGDAAKVLSNRQLLVGSFTMTLFVPCIATLMMMWKERGARTAAAIFLIVTGLAVGLGAVLNQVLLACQWS